LPVTLLALDMYPLQRLPWNWRLWSSPATRGVLLEKLPYFLLSAAAAVVNVAGEKSAGTLMTLEKLTVSARAAQVFYSVAFYIRKTLIPTHLMPAYERTPSDPFSSEHVIAAIIAIAFMALVIAARKRRPAVTVAGGHYLVTLAPVIGFFQFGASAVADRYSYLPCLCWPILAAGYVSSEWETFSSGTRTILRAGVVFSLAALGLITWRQIGIWHDSDALWNHVLKLEPENSLANNNRGADLLKRGRADESRTYFERSLASPTPEAHSNIADELSREGRLDEAEAHYKAALALDPKNPQINSQLGLLYAHENGRLEEAITYFRRSLAAAPLNADVRNNLGLALATQGKLEEALKEYRESLRQKPSIAAYNNVANALSAMGRLDEAAENYKTALKIDSTNSQIHFNLGIVYTRQNQFGPAIDEYQRALDLAPQCVPCQINIAYALAANNRPQEALSHCQEAIRLDPGNAQAQNILAEINTRLGR
jgi:tetratricopeptide (TPR) repeat protein